MRKVRFTRVNDIRIDEDLNVGVLEIEGKEYVILGGEFTASGVENYLRPYEKVKEKLGRFRTLCKKQKRCSFLYG